VDGALLDAGQRTDARGVHMEKGHGNGDDKDQNATSWPAGRRECTHENPPKSESDA